MKKHDLFFFLPHLGTQASFRRLYEEPIVRGQQPDASGEEKLLGQTRANEVSKNSVFVCLRKPEWYLQD